MKNIATVSIKDLYVQNIILNINFQTLEGWVKEA